MENAMLSVWLACVLCVSVHGLTKEEEAVFEKNNVIIIPAQHSWGKMTIVSSGSHPKYPPSQGAKVANKASPTSHKRQLFHVVNKPMISQVPHCLNFGAIGVAVDGVPFFSTASHHGRAVMDRCGGQLDAKGRYYYLSTPTCLLNNHQRNQLLGVARDGFPIYGPVDANGHVVKSSELDRCHGRFENGTYIYRLTYDSKNILNCFKGKLRAKKSHRCVLSGGMVHHRKNSPANEELRIKQLLIQTLHEVKMELKQLEAARLRRLRQERQKQNHNHPQNHHKNRPWQHKVKMHDYKHFG